MPLQSPLGVPFIELPVVDSTNNYAMGRVHAGMAQHGMAVFAHDQQAGKGQRGRQWISDSGSNIALSVVIDPAELSGTEPFLLSMAFALGARAFCERTTGAPFSIKWPNDLYWRDRKAAGILIENVWQGQGWCWAVGGIGINVNQTGFGDLADKAASLRMITGREYAPLSLAAELCADLEQGYRELLRRPRDVVEAFNAHLYRRGERVRLKRGSRAFEALIKRVNEKGELIVEHGLEEAFAVGEVEWVAASVG